MTYTKLLLIGCTSLLAGLFLFLGPVSEISAGRSDALTWLLAAIGGFLLLEGITMLFLGLQAHRRESRRVRTYGEESTQFDDDRPQNPHQPPGAGIQGQPGGGL